MIFDQYMSRLLRERAVSVGLKKLLFYAGYAGLNLDEPCIEIGKAAKQPRIGLKI